MRGFATPSTLARQCVWCATHSLSAPRSNARGLGAREGSENAACGSQGDAGKGGYRLIPAARRIDSWIVSGGWYKSLFWRAPPANPRAYQRSRKRTVGITSGDTLGVCQHASGAGRSRGGLMLSLLDAAGIPYSSLLTGLSSTHP